MALETGTYISDLVSTNPVSGDPKSQGDDHIRLLKSTIKATFPNVNAAVTPTDEELNFVDGVTSNIQTQLDLKAPLASPILTGVPEAPTAALGTSNTQIATTQFVADTIIAGSLPGQTGNDGKVMMTDGTNADWSDTMDLDVMVPAVGTRIATTTGTETLTHKTATDLILADDADPTKKANFVLSGVTAGQNRSLTVEDRNTLVMTPGWVYLSTVTASTSATVDIETTLNSTYKQYVIVLEDVVQASSGVDLWMRFKIAGAYHSGASDYSWSYTGTESTVVTNFDIADSQAVILENMSQGAARPISGMIVISNPASTTANKRAMWDLLYWRSTTTNRPARIMGQVCDLSSTGAVTGVRIMASSGTITSGTFKLFGIRGA